jgi:low affinity Fe/Cu permease
MLDLLAAEMIPDEWSQLAIQLGVAAILAWYLFFTTSKTLPAMLEQFQKQIADQATKHNESVIAITDRQNNTVRHVVDRFSNDLEREREARQEALDILTKTFICHAQYQQHQHAHKEITQ